jgi:transcriptional regulator with XRE-family HTH domain
MDLSARLDKAMKAAGYKSQTALAEKAGVSQSAVNRILKRAGKQGPDTATIAKLAIACGVTPEYLISGIVSQLEKSAMPALALVYLTPEELQLITQYREATIAGKHLIEVTAQNAPKESPPTSTDDE